MNYYEKRREEFNTMLACEVSSAAFAKQISPEELEEISGVSLGVITDEHASLSDIMSILLQLELTLVVAPASANEGADERIANMAREMWEFS